LKKDSGSFVKPLGVFLRVLTYPSDRLEILICYNETDKPHGKTISSQLSDKSGPAHAAARKTIQADSQPLAESDPSKKLLRPWRRTRMLTRGTSLRFGASWSSPYTRTQIT